jgi:hypothetical protein
MSGAAANLWIFEEACRSGLSPRKVTEQIVAGGVEERYAVFAPREQRIA